MSTMAEAKDSKGPEIEDDAGETSPLQSPKHVPELVEGIDLMLIPWYHPKLTRHLAEAELSQTDEGVYLLRPRTDHTTGKRKGYALDVRCQQSVKHFMVTVKKGRITFGQEIFRDVTSFLEHFDNCPLIGDDTGKLIVCKYPFPRDVEEIHDYQFVTSHFVTGRPVEVVGRDRVTYSLASKEGYLTKLGAVVKSWKHRWFVLRNEELSYYAKENEKRPIRVINLKEVTEVSSCEISEKQNVFRIIVPWRTFYLQAPTSDVRDDWIRILRWKLREIQEAGQEHSHTCPPELGKPRAQST